MMDTNELIRMPKSNLQSWIQSIDMKWSDPFHYFSVWTFFAFLLIPDEIILLQQIKWNMLLQTYITGIYLTYVYPKIINIHYLNLKCHGFVLQVVDFIAHQVPFYITFFFQTLYPTTSWLEYIIVNLPLLYYLYKKDIKHYYHVRETDVFVLLIIYPIVKYIMDLSIITVNTNRALTSF